MKEEGGRVVKRPYLFSLVLRGLFLFAPVITAGCAATSSPDDDISFESTGNAEEVGFIPSVYIANESGDTCSGKNQKFSLGDIGDNEDGYTCLQLFFGTNRQLQDKVVNDEGLFVPGKATPNPVRFFGDNRFNPLDVVDEEIFLLSVSDGSISGNNNLLLGSTIDAYRQGVATVSVPKRKPGELIDSFDYKQGWVLKRRKEPTRSDRNERFAFVDYALTSSEEFWGRAKEMQSLSSQLDVDAWTRDENSVLVFVHGFNVGFDGAAYRTAQLVYDLNYAGVPIFFSWPANSQGGLRGVLGYFNDIAEGLASVGDLKKFLIDVRDELQPSTYILIAHSHGNQIVLNALNEIAADRPDLKDMFDAIIFASPDVDAVEFQRINVRISNLARSRTLYTSQDDGANTFRSFLTRLGLRESEAKPRAGMIPKRGPYAGVPAIVPGVDTVDVTEAETGALGDHLGVNDDGRRRSQRQDRLRHSIYADAKDIVCDLALLIREASLSNEVPAPHVRLEAMEEKVTDYGRYWRFDSGAEPRLDACLP